MPGETGKRKKAEQDSGDEIQPERLNKLQRIGNRTVSFATTIQGECNVSLNPNAYSNNRQTAISFNKYQHPNSILETPPTSSPTALGSPKREQSPLPEASEQPEETSEIKQLKHDLASALKDLKLSKNDNSHLRWRVEIYMNASNITDRALEDVNKRLNDAEARFKETLCINAELKDKLRAANETVEKVRCELAIVRGEEKKSEMEISSQDVKTEED